ncbi:hypothetical protein HDV06_000177 [Boothiomyces sp. JEL0866]|nr:hypothetical protein HDV06_000177 [Boothiomyces sp. JEL0866]
MKASPKFAVHILSSKQISHSIAFSSPKTQSDFAKFPHYIDNLHNELPILQGCLSVLICKPFKTDSVGDHDVWYGEIVDIQADGIKMIQGVKEPLKPLLYFDSKYRSIGDEVFIEAFENSKLDFQDWTHRAHVRMAWIYIRDKSYSQEESFEMIKYSNLNNRKGIIQYNRANAARINHGYNHTITTFFSKLVAMALENDLKNGIEKDDFLEFLERYPKLDTFTYIFNYYDKDILYSDKAKTTYPSFNIRFIEPSFLPTIESLSQ